MGGICIWGCGGYGIYTIVTTGFLVFWGLVYILRGFVCVEKFGKFDLVWGKWVIGCVLREGNASDTNVRNLMGEKKYYFFWILYNEGLCLLVETSYCFCRLRCLYGRVGEI